MEEANKLKTDIDELNTKLSKLELTLKNQNIIPCQDEVSQLKPEIKQLKVDLEEKGGEIKVLKSQLEEIGGEIKVLKSQVEDLSAKLRKIDILSTYSYSYRDTIGCFKVFISEKLSKVNQEMNDWTKIKNTLIVEKYKNPKVVTGQLENVLESLGLTYKEFNNLLGLKQISNTTFHISFSLENLQEIKSHLKNTQFSDDWEPTKQALTKIMDPLEKWLLLQQAPKHKELVTKTYDEYLVEKSKNISLPEIRNQMRELINQNERFKRSDDVAIIKRSRIINMCVKLK